MAIITLTTDFGHKDHFVGAIKGTILSNLPEASVVDISHSISPFNIQECAYILKNAYRSFPAGTVHIVGVDSEQSEENQHIVGASGWSVPYQCQQWGDFVDYLRSQSRKGYGNSYSKP